MKDNSSLFRLAGTIIAAVIGVILIGYGVIAYVAVHFLRKVW